jgi:hypothetical protein
MNKTHKKLDPLEKQVFLNLLLEDQKEVFNRIFLNNLQLFQKFQEDCRKVELIDGYAFETGEEIFLLIEKYKNPKIQDALGHLATSPFYFMYFRKNAFS